MYFPDCKLGFVTPPKDSYPQNRMLVMWKTFCRKTAEYFDWKPTRGELSTIFPFKLSYGVKKHSEKGEINLFRYLIEKASFASDYEFFNSFHSARNLTLLFVRIFYDFRKCGFICRPLLCRLCRRGASSCLKVCRLPCEFCQHRLRKYGLSSS